jgi:hypothetical protein
VIALVAQRFDRSGISSAQVAEHFSDLRRSIVEQRFSHLRPVLPLVGRRFSHRWLVIARVEPCFCHLQLEIAGFRQRSAP